MSKSSCHECKWSASAARVFDPPQAGLVCLYPFPEGPNYALVDPAYAGLCSFFAVELFEEKTTPSQAVGSTQTSKDPDSVKRAGRPRVTPAGCPTGESLGEKIRLARQKKGLSQDRLAAMLGVHRVTLADWETGRALPRRRAMLLLERLLGPFDFRVS